MTTARARQAIAMLVAGALILGACKKKASNDTSTACANSKSEINVQVASYDLAVGDPSRFLVGVLTKDNRFVGFGSVDLSFAYCGTKDKPEQGRFGSRTAATFLPVPEEAGEVHQHTGEGPAAVPASKGRGVYAATTGFDRAGFWQVKVSAGLVGEGNRTGTADFQVLPEHRIPAPGDAAIASENLTIAAEDVPLAAIDSRAQATESIPDPELHSMTIAQAMSLGRPALVVFSTPAFCRSRFCGPVTDMVAGLAKVYANRAAFIHIEIWRDFENSTINKAAQDWLYRDGDLTEPWVFLIGADGKIVARWDNVATQEEVEPLIKALPAR